MSAVYTDFRACLHGIDAAHVKLRRDERHDALYIELDEGGHVGIRIDLKDRDVLGGLRQLAGVAEQAALELGQLLGLGGDEDQGADDTQRLGEIRALLARFDWQHDDRQLALEAIERIADGGEA